MEVGAPWITFIKVSKIRTALVYQRYNHSQVQFALCIHEGGAHTALELDYLKPVSPANYVFIHGGDQRFFL